MPTTRPRIATSILEMVSLDHALVETAALCSCAVNLHIHPNPCILSLSLIWWVHVVTCTAARTKSICKMTVLPIPYSYLRTANCHKNNEPPYLPYKAVWYTRSLSISGQHMNHHYEKDMASAATKGWVPVFFF